MIVTCPNCSAQYRVPDKAIVAKGRKVRCRNCRHSWVQRPPEPPKPAKAPGPTPPKAILQARPAPPPPPEMGEDDPLFAPRKPGGLEDDPLFGDNRRGDPLFGEEGGKDDILALEDDPFESRLARKRAQAEEGLMAARRPKVPEKSATPVWVYAGFAGLVVFLGASGYGLITFRDMIARAFPPSAALYAGLANLTGQSDLAVNVRGLIFRGVDHARGYIGDEPYLTVSGAVVNTTEEEMPVPPIRIAFHDMDKKLLAVQLARAQSDTLAPGLSAKFGVRMNKVAEGAAFIEVAFARPEEIPKEGVPAPDVPKPKPETTEGAGEAAATGAMEAKPEGEPAAMDKSEPAPAAPSAKPH